MSLNNLGNDLRHRYSRTRIPDDIDKAISHHQRAVDLVSLGNLNRLIYLDTLSVSLMRRFQETGSLKDLDRAISAGRETIINPDGNPVRKVQHLNGLASALGVRFIRTGREEDIDEAIKLHEEAIQSIPADERDVSLLEAAITFRRRYTRSHSVIDIDQSLILGEKAVSAVEQDHQSRPLYLHFLGSMLLDKFECTGDLGALERSARVRNEVVDITPENDPNRSEYLFEQGRVLEAQHEQSNQQDPLAKTDIGHRPPSSILLSSTSCITFANTHPALA